MSPARLALLIPALLAACAPGPIARPDPGLVPAGVAGLDITPTEPVRLTGYPNRAAEPFERVEQRLQARALALGGDRPSVLIATDLIAVPSHVTEEVARRLQRAGVERARLAVTATHTHTGPALAGTLPHIFGGPVPPEQHAAIERYTAGLADRLERVALAALADRRPARLSWNRGSATFAANRRVITNGVWTGFGVTPGGAVDHDLPVLRVDAPDGRLRAVLLGYAAHATTLEGKHNFVHGDWPGSAREEIERRFPGALALVTIGAAADANPDPRGGGLADVEANARAVAREVEQLLAAPGTPLTRAPEGRIRTIQLPFHRLPTADELRQRAGRADAEGEHARAALARLERGEALPASAPYPVQSWTFGDGLAMVFLGGEVVADYALRLKRELDGERVWVTAYANDVAFYVASRRMIPEGGYEVDRSMVFYGQPARFAEETEDRIVEAVHELVPNAFRRR